MDPFTHAILGAATSYALFGRRLGRRAAAVGALAGIAPDADHFVSSGADPLLYVEYHRHFTHALFFAPVGALIATLPWIVRERFRPQWLIFWLCALPAYLIHGLLDASTTYGTQLYWPFSRARAGWDLISIIDPIFTLGLGAALLAGLKKRNHGLAMAGLVFAAAYIGLGAVQRNRAESIQLALASARGHQPERSRVMPTLANNLVWRSLYLADGRIYSDRIRVGWFSSGTFWKGSSLPQITRDDLTPFEQEANRHTAGYTRFAWFSDNWLARAPVDETVLGDMRYSMSTRAFDPIWGIRFVQEREAFAVEWVNRSQDRRPDVRELWSEIRGTYPDYRSPEVPDRSP